MYDFKELMLKLHFLKNVRRMPKGVIIRSCNFKKDRQYNGQKEIKEKQSATMAVKILHGKLNIKQDEHTKIGINLVSEE